MKKAINCNSCDLKNTSARSCEFCPERRETPLYKKPWFWILLLTAIAITAINAINIYQPSKDSVHNDPHDRFNDDCKISATASINKSSTGMQELTLFVTNLTGKNIASFNFFAFPSSIYKKLEKTAPQSHTYKGVEIPSGSSVFSSHQFIKNYHGDVKLYIYSVDFSDGSQWGDKTATSGAIRKNGIAIDVRSLDG